MRKGHSQVFLLMCAHVLPCIYSQDSLFASAALMANVLWGSWGLFAMCGFMGSGEGIKSAAVPH